MRLGEWTGEKVYGVNRGKLFSKNYCFGYLQNWSTEGHIFRKFVYNQMVWKGNGDFPEL